MANLPAEVGFLTLVDDVITAYSDSSDSGDVPDVTQATALITITPDGIPASRPFVVVGATNKRIHLSRIDAFLANGKLYRTADGKKPAPNESPTTEGIPLVAPQQGTIDLTNWRWIAHFEPGDGETWGAYDVVITGAPGTTVSIGAAVMLRDFMEGLPTVKNALGIVVTPANPANPPLVSDIPAGAGVGDTLIDTTKTPPQLYLIGVV